MAGTFPDSWTETALVSIMKKGGTKYEFAAITETIDISEPDYPGESLMMVGGARLFKQSPQEDGEITLELYPLELDTTAGQGLFQEFTGGTWDVAQPLITDTSWAEGIQRPRDRFLVAIMWTDDTTQDSAIDIDATGTANTVATRFYAKECRLISHKADFTDGILKVTATFKFPALDSAGTTKSHAWESSNDMLVSGSADLVDLTYA
ncbi:MAG: hypothetical protein CL811_06650 [Colwelliaceae bacterium]|nr:hypothetical protein [Colwelliaceae bacterium]